MDHLDSLPSVDSLPSGCVPSMLKQVFDYAGLFPPAKLSMSAAVRNYREYLKTSNAWLLGRFIVPADRLEELSAQPRAEDDSTWNLSVLVSDWTKQQPHIEKWHARNQDSFHIEAAECRFEQLATGISESFTTYVEIGFSDQVDHQIETLKQNQLHAKLRCGGLTPAAFPSPNQLVSVLSKLNSNKVAFKATAGLHHLVADSRPAFDAPEAPTVAMHGFFSLVLAVAFIRLHPDAPDVAERVLSETQFENFTVSSTGVEWNGFVFPESLLRQVRNESFHSIGSCSFLEPIEELKQANILA